MFAVAVAFAKIMLGFSAIAAIELELPNPSRVLIIEDPRP